jgi:glycerophosphoryl diester phosphodiesterase family protein
LLPDSKGLIRSPYIYSDTKGHNF